MNLDNMKLPPIYTREGKPCYMDPIRKKLIPVTPEETVRQKMIAYLLSELKVPANMITVEEPLSHYGLKSREQADIIICGMNDDDLLEPLAVVECKAETVYLDEKAVNQGLDYCDSLGATYACLTNGIQEFSYQYGENDYSVIEMLPPYSEMLKGHGKEVPMESPPERLPFDELEPFLREAFKEEREKGFYGDISHDTPMDLALPLFNLWEGILDVRVKMPAGDYGLFRLVEDQGVRILSFGNGSGGVFSGPYRSFLVERDGENEVFSISISTYGSSGGKEKLPATAVSIGRERKGYSNQASAHHALQLVAENDCAVKGDTVHFYHNGRIGIGRIGSGKRAEVLELVEERYPEILRGKEVYLGKITNDHLLTLDEPDVTALIANLINYSIIRDEYRDLVKKRNG